MKEVLIYMRKAIEIKSEVVSEIVEKLQKSSAAVVVDYKGLTVELMP